MRKTLLAVIRKVGDMPDLAEGLGEIVGCIAVVFNDEEAHDDPISFATAGTRTAAAAGTWRPFLNLRGNVSTPGIN